MSLRSIQGRLSALALRLRVRETAPPAAGDRFGHSVRVAVVDDVAHVVPVEGRPVYGDGLRRFGFTQAVSLDQFILNVLPILRDQMLWQHASLLRRQVTTDHW